MKHSKPNMPPQSLSQWSQEKRKFLSLQLKVLPLAQCFGPNRHCLMCTFLKFLPKHVIQICAEVNMKMSIFKMSQIANVSQNPVSFISLISTIQIRMLIYSWSKLSNIHTHEKCRLNQFLVIKSWPSDMQTRGPAPTGEFSTLRLRWRCLLEVLLNKIHFLQQICYFQILRLPDVCKSPKFWWIKMKK